MRRRAIASGKNCFYSCHELVSRVWTMQVDAVLFDLFGTLLLLEDTEAYYEPCLKKMHEFLAQNGVDVSFDEFQRAYFDVRDRFYSESRESLEEPHFNVRVVQTLEKLGYNFRVFDKTVAGVTMSFADEFMRHVHPDKDAAYVLRKLHLKYKLGLSRTLAFQNAAENCWRCLV